MTNTSKPDLTKLDFSEIKTSLTDYLKNQSIFSGYEFNGSVMQTIIDLLAYNTYYYAFYSNMLSSEVFLDSAKKTNSLVSLVTTRRNVAPSSCEKELDTNKFPKFVLAKKFLNFLKKLV